MSKIVIPLLGLIVGLVGFLLIFKIFFLPNIPREDEVPPGIVVMAAILNGILFAWLGRLVQKFVTKKPSL